MKSIALGLVLTFALAPLLAAEEVSARYAHFLYGGGSFGVPGWQASLASDTGALRFVMDAGGLYSGGSGFHTFLIGPRLVSREARGVTVFGQLLVGAGIDDGAMLMFCPGIGVDAPASEAFAVRVQAELPMFVTYGIPRTLRLSAGIVVRLGRP